jgi:hypothetical protein
MLLEGEEVVKEDMAECKFSPPAMKITQNQLLMKLNLQLKDQINLASVNSSS